MDAGGRATQEQLPSSYKTFKTASQGFGSQLMVKQVCGSSLPFGKYTLTPI